MRQKPLIIGITGGIGSGKTTVAKIFEKMGIPIYIADDKARDITASDPDILDYIRRTFGDDVFDDQGQLIRKKLGDKVFGHEEKLRALNEMIHPKVGSDFSTWVAGQQSPYVLKEAAVLFESGTYHDCDYIILVVAPKDLRIERVMKRSGLSREDIEARMHHQWSDDDKMALSDFVIHNDEQRELMPQIYDIHEDLKRFANQ